RSRRANGNTQTFRRPSHAASLSNAVNTSAPAASPGVYVPPHRNGNLIADGRYPKDSLLSLFRSQPDDVDDGLSELYAGGWEPYATNGASGAPWGRNNEHKENQPTVDVCWERDGSMDPLNLVEMTEDEKEHFTSVNSPLKIPNQAAAKEGTPKDGIAGRKTSISHSNGPGNFALASPTTARPGARRRETGEAYPFPSTSTASPATSRFERSESNAPVPPPALLRRRTDYKEPATGQGPEERDKDKAREAEPSNPFGSLKRSATGPFSAGVSGPSSPWSAGPQTAGFAPMGSFGNFALGGAGQAPTPTEKRPGLGSMRGESRFKGLMSKESSEDMNRSVRERASLASLGKLNENESGRQTPSWMETRASRPMSNDTDPYADDDNIRAGSAALGGGQDASPPRRQVTGFGTPHRQESRDESGFAAFGMTTDNAGHSNIFHGRDQYHHTPQHGGGLGSNEPMSPTDTNPYQSPEHEKEGPDDLDTDGSDIHNAHLPGLGGFLNEPTSNAGMSAFGGLGGLGRGPSAFEGAASDRSQTSSVGANRGFPTLGGLGGLPGLGGASAWTSQPAVGTPSRERAFAPFGDTFGSVGEMQSPSLAGLGPNNLFGGGIGSGLGPPRETESPFRTDRGVFEEIMGNLGAIGQRALPQGIPGQAQAVSSSASNQPPAAQQRTMVMPDRMRWIYRDPQGNTQGPWSGLEMHDWYKAGFFSPELLVKKYEDPDYEPLAQLIRRIGNSREPFLVPQIGIPHGPPTTQPGNAWAGAGLATAAGSSGGAQPPFASSFPSFGTTLTAEQQNALERRKQEEQYLMARQKEHLAQQQVLVKQMQMGGPHTMHPQQLHHHSSAHSLHSQPSFGSITSPGGYQQSPTQGPIPGTAGFFDNSFRPGPVSSGLPPIGAGMEMLGNIREEEMPGLMERMNLGRGQFGGAPGPFGPNQQQDQHSQQVAAMLNDRARLQQEQAEHDALMNIGEDQQSKESQDRLRQFHDLRAQADEEESNAETGSAPGVIGRPSDDQQERAEQHREEILSNESEPGAPAMDDDADGEDEPMSLTEQVKAASAKQTPAPQSPWAKVDTSMPMPFPPPQSGSPLPAPAAQRKQNLADALNAESRSRSQTPSVETPSASIAPWAKETTEAPKGPSLKEIQEAEAKKAAQAEAAAAAARREALEKELLAQAQQAAPAPGLPSSSTWASSASPVSTPAAPSPWAKTVVAKPAQSPGPKKTLQQIQKEEEARKMKAAAAAAAAAAQQNAANAVNAAAVSQAMAGKRYADLASKASAPAGNGPAAGGAWTTVGASGKVKAPAVTIPANPSAGPRSASGTPTMAKPKPAVPARTATASTPLAGAVNAQDEFKKWAAGELRSDLNKGINVDDFILNLMSFPSEIDIVTEAVHSVSQTIDSRHFAEEFIRRRKLADKGIVDPVGTASPSAQLEKAGGGGWSEVAKKGPAGKGGAAQAAQTAVDSADFKVVPAKKKGGKR
ncbi:hypothetical protein K490DRAFT_37669, partial [Saccharata proteae CBS 121410]